ncbi:Six-hairpin glycosidase-like protein [Rhizoctonia solani]|nr:Six-hairpin glycosidase-like protein [Rhizoctonia solani]
MPRVLATSLLALHAAAQFAFAQNPENKANSVVPYEVPAEPRYDYAEVLHKSLLFYHAQRSGKLGPNRRLAWRGDSCFDCIGPNGEDLSGGYFEAANTMKWGLPLAWTLTQLSFNVHVFSEAMQAVNEYDEALEGIKWGTDYLVNCISSPDQFVGQFGVSAIGDTDIDFGYFGPAEEYEMWAPRGIKRSEGIAYINSTNPSSEILGESAAALAAASVVFAKKDKDYSDKLRGHAVDLFTRATTNQGSYMRSTHPNLQTVKSWYPSTIFEDELAWAAAWLYVATGDEQWKRTADEWIAKAGSHLGEYSWDEKLPGAHMLLYMQTKNETHKAAVEQYFTTFQPNGTVKQTAKGLSFFYGWGSLRYASNVGFIMMAYSKTIGYDNPNATWPRQYAAQQINYALGDAGRSWVVGFGKDSPVRPYHKSSYNSFIDYPMRGQDNGAQGQDFLFSSTVNRFILYGALEGGPAWNDSFKDDRSAYEYTDKSYVPVVTQDYNAAFTGLNAAMIDYYGHSKFKAFTDCGLDLGWSHPNASNPPQWPENDCYHTCNTNCVKTNPEDDSTTGNNTTPEQSGSTGGAIRSVSAQGLAVAVIISSIMGALTLL